MSLTASASVARLRQHLLPLALAGATLLPAAHAADFVFYQDGYADGAVVTGHFAGEDSDGDGWLLPYELSDFSLSFSGNSLVGAFTHSLANGGAGGLSYRLDSSSFDDHRYGGWSTVGALDDNDGAGLIRFSVYDWETEALPGAVTDLQRQLISYTTRPMQVAAVPEPQTALLLASGVLAVAWRARRQRCERGRR